MINSVKKMENEKMQNPEEIFTLFEVTKNCMYEFNPGIENISNIIANAENLLQFITMTKMFESTPYFLQLKKIPK